MRIALAGLLLFLATLAPQAFAKTFSNDFINRLVKELPPGSFHGKGNIGQNCWVVVLRDSSGYQVRVSNERGRAMAFHLSVKNSYVPQDLADVYLDAWSRQPQTRIIATDKGSMGLEKSFLLEISSSNDGRRITVGEKSSASPGFSTVACTVTRRSSGW